MTQTRIGGIGDDHPQLAELKQHLRLGALMPLGSEPHRLATRLRDLPTLPDRFNASFIDAGWIFVEFACDHEAAERALTMQEEGAGADATDRYLAAEFLGVEPIKWQAIKLLGGGMVEPAHPVRAEVTERAIAAYEAGDYLVAVPLILMLVDGFGVTVTGTKSMFSDLTDLHDLFQSTESMGGHPSALKPLLARLQRGQRGYSEEPLALPLRNGILHGTRLNYANEVVAAKALNLLAAVIEWARDIAPEPADEKARKAWNERFLRGNLERLKPDTPQRALEVFSAALANGRASDLVALIDYHPVHTSLAEKIREWRELEDVEVGIHPLSEWESFGPPRAGQTGRCDIRLTLRRRGGELVSDTRERVYAARSAELTKIGLPAYWQISLTLLGLIRKRIGNA
jgi:hypothetical protein